MKQVSDTDISSITFESSYTFLSIDEEELNALGRER